MLVSVTEAVNNAIIHGNRLDPQKKVLLSARMITPFLLSISVEDEGEGFDYRKLNDPTDPSYLLNEHGRGVFVIQHLADAVQYHGKGNVIEMRFNI
jgi:serine/threonine-protein kinase RsbW